MFENYLDGMYIVCRMFDAILCFTYLVSSCSLFGCWERKENEILSLVIESPIPGMDLKLLQ